MPEPFDPCAAFDKAMKEERASKLVEAAMKAEVRQAIEPIFKAVCLAVKEKNIRVGDIPVTVTDPPYDCQFAVMSFSIRAGKLELWVELVNQAKKAGDPPIWSYEIAHAIGQPPQYLFDDWRGAFNKLMKLIAKEVIDGEKK